MSFCILTLLSCFNLLTTCFHLLLILPRVPLLSLCVSTACKLRYVIYNTLNLPVRYSSLIFMFLKGILLPQLRLAVVEQLSGETVTGDFCGLLQKPWIIPKKELLFPGMDTAGSCTVSLLGVSTSGAVSNMPGIGYEKKLFL